MNLQVYLKLPNNVMISNLCPLDGAAKKWLGWTQGIKACEHSISWGNWNLMLYFILYLVVLREWDLFVEITVRPNALLRILLINFKLEANASLLIAFGISDNDDDDDNGLVRSSKVSIGWNSLAGAWHETYNEFRELSPQEKAVN